jgi:hypothetical protein
LSRERFGLTGLASVSSSAHLSEPLAELGAFAEGIATGEEAIRIAETVDHPFSRVMAYWGMGNLYLYKGGLTKAISILDRGLELCQTLHIPLLFPLVASALGAATALSGRIAEALPWLEQAVEQGTLGRHRLYLPRWTIQLSSRCVHSWPTVILTWTPYTVGSGGTLRHRAVGCHRALPRHGDGLLAQSCRSRAGTGGMKRGDKSQKCTVRLALGTQSCQP